MHIGVLHARRSIATWQDSFACTPGLEAHIQALCKQGHVESAVLALSPTHGTLSSSTYLSLLNACCKTKSLALAKRLHAHLTARRAHLSSFLTDFWVMTLAKCGAIDDALQVSASLPHLTVFSWTAMIFACAECGRGIDAFRMHQRMLDDGVQPDKYTFVSLFKACGALQDLQLGTILYADACKKGITYDVFVCNTLVSMYGKCGAMIDAEEVFFAVPHRTVSSWNAMLSAYIDLEQGERALLLYRQMEHYGERVNEITLVLALQACSLTVQHGASHCVTCHQTEKQSMHMIRALHSDAYRKGCASKPLVGSTLVSTYSKCGAISEAENVFIRLYDRNVVSWTAIASACMECGQGEKALQLFAHIHREGVSPNQLTYIATLQACSGIIEKEESLIDKERSGLATLLEIVQALHADCREQGYMSDALVSNTFISVYGKCGAVVEAEAVYQGLSTHTAVSDNLMISAYMDQGELDKASHFCKQLQVKHANVDEVTLIYMLKLFSEMGSLEICSSVHFNIVSAGCDTDPSVSATLIHAYGNCGSSIAAQVVFDECCQPDRAQSNACIAGYAGEGNRVAMFMFEKSMAEGVQPDKVSFTSILSACCHTGLIMEGLEYFDSMHADIGITPNEQHYGVLSDLLGRAGSFARIENLLQNPVTQTDVDVWLSLLGACCIHGSLELASTAFKNAARLIPKEAVTYVLMSNIYGYFGDQHLEMGNLE